MPPWHSNLTKRLVKIRKLYLLDTGLAAYLTEWSSPQTLEAGAMSGAILETWVVTELLKSYLHNGLAPPFYYFRDKDKREIDLLIIGDNILHPLECKKSTSPGKDDIRCFSRLSNLGISIGSGGVICLSPQALPLTRTAWSIPIGAC